MPNNALYLAKELVSIPSVSGNELEVLEYLTTTFTSFGWQYEKLEISEKRFNIFVTFGNPDICFTTHVDVVPAREHQFSPEIKNGRLYGRGACDAKGILASMICAVRNLELDGESSMSLLVVVGEETDGIGAKTASKQLSGRGIRYLVNGEPTEGKLVSAHKGGLGFRITTRGISCHSGYPEYGVNANSTLIDIAYQIQNTSFGEDPVLGAATVNLGLIKAGSAGNVISDFGQIHGMIRTVTDSESVIASLEEIISGRAELEILNNAPKVHLKTLPGFEISTVSYVTDIPHFLPLGAESLLYGPGSIRQAHTDDEWIDFNELEDSVSGYCRIFKNLHGQR
jgi:acetylornithine deacetylase